MMKRITSLSVVAVFCMSAVFAVVHADGGEDVFEVSEPVAQQQVAAQADSPEIVRPTRTIIFHNEEKNYYDTIPLIRKFISWVPEGGRHLPPLSHQMQDNYRVSVGYSGLLGANAFINYSLMNRDKTYRGNTLHADRVVGLDYGLGFMQNGIFALSMGGRFSLMESNDYNMFLSYGYYLGGVIGFSANIDILYKQWMFSIGPMLGTVVEEDETSFSISLNASYFLNEINMPVRTLINPPLFIRNNPRENRYFRPGIEFYYPISRSDLEYWDNTDLAAGAGLFFRIGPEPVYFTTGAYLRAEVFEKEHTASMPVDIMGIPIGDIPLVDLTVGIINWSLEVPILLNYMLAKQVRFTAGALLDFSLDRWFVVEAQINENIPWVGGSSIWEWEGRMEDSLDGMLSEYAPSGNMYWVFGVDFDIFRYWGIGLKYIIHNNSFGDSDMYQEYFEPSKNQIRLSTYFVF